MNEVIKTLTKDDFNKYWDKNKSDIKINNQENLTNYAKRIAYKCFKHFNLNEGEYNEKVS